MKSKTIGQYRITDRKIGEGAFGTVFIGIDLSDNNKEVAVKVVEHSRLEGYHALSQVTHWTTSMRKYWQ